MSSFEKGLALYLSGPGQENAGLSPQLWLSEPYPSTYHQTFGFSIVKTIFLEIPLAFGIAHIDVRVVVLPIPRLFHVYSTAIIAAFQFKLLLCILFLKLVLKRASLTKSA